MKILYFAWLRTRVGLGQEQVEPPPGVDTVGGLVDGLNGRGPGHAAALDDLSAVRVAVNQEFADWDHPVAADDEVALFPPITGG